MKHILILSNENCCYSQMLHGFLAQSQKDQSKIYSAGPVADGVQAQAIREMARRGIVIAGHSSHSYHEYQSQRFDWVISCHPISEDWQHYWPSAHWLQVQSPEPPLEWADLADLAQAQTKMLLPELR